MNFARYWKAIIAAVGLALTVLTALQPVWGDDVPSWVPVVTAVLTAVGVYLKANAPAPADPEPVSAERLAVTEPQAGQAHVKPVPPDGGYGLVGLVIAVLVIVLLVLLILRYA